MGINLQHLKKYEEAYRNIPETIVPFEFLPESPYYHMEEWREVLPMFVPGVLPHTYWISSHGRLWSSLKSTIHPNGGIKAHSINGKGYHQVDLKGINGQRICVKITRLVMLHFRFVPNCHLMEVDHLDGNKDNNVLWNFQWVLPKENTHRAIINQQRTIAVSSGYYEPGYTTLLSDYDARMLFFRYVINKEPILNLASEYNVTVDYIKGLHGGSIRPYISKEYKNGTFVPPVQQ